MFGIDRTHIWGSTYKRMGYLGHYLCTAGALPIHAWGTWGGRGTRTMFGTDHTMFGIDRKISGIDRTMFGIYHTMLGIDRKMFGIDRIMFGINIKCS